MRSQCGGLRARAGSQPGADSALTPRHAPCAAVLLADRRGGRRFRQFRYRTHSSWSRKRRVIGKAEHLRQGANPRFVVTNLELSEIQSPQRLYEQVYCARGEMENRIKEQQLCLFADRTSSATMRANQLRLYLSTFAYVLMNTVREVGLAGTAMAKAQCSTIRLKLFKIAAVIRITTRKVWLSLSSVHPFQHLYATALRNLRAPPHAPPLAC